MTKLYQKFLTFLAFLKVLFFGSSAPRGILHPTKLGRAPDGSIRLAFCGKMKSGKDTAASLLKGLCGGTVMHIFASGYRATEWLLLYPLFGAKIDPDNKTKLERLALQWVGHWGRVLFGKDVWLKRTLKIIANLEGNVYIVGVRYPNEVKKLREIGVQSVWIDRPEEDRIAAGAFNLNHETETALDGYTDFDFRIPNDKDLDTFKRRVQCYAHIDGILDTIKEGRNRSVPVTTFMDGGTQHGMTQLDDGVDRGWHPTEGDDRPKNFEDLAAQKLIEGKSLDQIRTIAAACEMALTQRGERSYRYFDKYNVKSHEIAQEIRRFADIVDYDLKVSDGQVANATVKKTLHAILDNRPINGNPDPVETPKTREEVIQEIQALAASIGEDCVRYEETTEEIAAALAYYRNRPTDNEQATVSKALTLLAKEKLRRDAWNKERRERRAAANRQKLIEAGWLRKSKTSKKKAAAKGKRK